MSTNYGARPGLEVQEPRTMSAEQERALFMTMAQGHPLLGERFGGSWAVTATAIKRELDAERAAHRATLDVLNEIAVNMTNHADKPICAYVKRAAESAIAQARGSRGAK